MACERTAQPLDTVVWERDGGLYSGIIWELRGEFASILALHGGALVHTKDLQVLLPHEDWNPQELVNHLWAVYGIRLEEDDEGFPPPVTNQLDAAGQQ